MANNLDINKTVEAWADIVIKNWRQKIKELDIHEPGPLYDSFVFDVIGNAGGNPERIDFAFEYYGRFVDMGVGKGVKMGNPNNVVTKREPKKWYSKTMYRQAQKLSEILAVKYSIKGASVIREKVQETDKR